MRTTTAEGNGDTKNKKLCEPSNFIDNLLSMAQAEGTMPDVDALTRITYLSCGITPSYMNHVALPLYFRLQ